MSEWYWKVIALKAAFVLSCFVSYLDADNNVQKLPFCNPTNPKDGSVFNDLMIVSTLDGKLTAFSTQSGVKAWHIDSQPLLSSNLHHVELTANGKWVRLVPSLRGSLYSLSGDTIEPLPFDAEQLLSSSYKYSDDLVIAGARETVWVGIDANSGNVIYECGSSGCSSEQAASTGRDVLVLRRHSNTVRALDPRVGNEKWNFSVAEHQLALNRGSCVGGANTIPAAVGVAVALHDGRIALRDIDATHNIWQQQLDAPLAGMWRLAGGALQNIDVVFEATQSIAGGLTQRPSLYIGVHDTQLYIQESPSYTRNPTAVAASPIPWKLVTARPALGADTALTVQDTDNSLSQVMLYGPKGLIGNHGYFLYLEQTCDQSVQTTEDAIDADTMPNNSDETHEHHHIHVHVSSLWYWWKEVLVIAISSGLLMNLMIWPRFFAPKTLPISKPPPELTKSKMVAHYERFPSNQLQATHSVAMTHIHALQDGSANVPEYSGRSDKDFTPLRYLGKGGFGVVFEVRNNIDHCSYALKRITLPQKESKRERVLREVRALAKLDHVNIVRYFNAWVEQPPPSWQQQRDAELMRELEGGSAISDEKSEITPTPVTPVKLPRAREAKGDSVILNLHKPFDAEAADYDRHEPSKRNRSLSCSDSIVFDSNAPGGHSIDHNIGGHNSVGHTPNNPLSCSDSIVFDSNAPGAYSTGHKSRGHNSGDHNSIGHHEAKNNSFDKRLERVKECDGFTDKTESTSSKKKKKGHTRHWSLDICVKSDSQATPVQQAPMYLYIQMQLCRRDSLHDWLRNNRTVQQRDYREIKSLFSQIVSAVDYVHRAGLIHRDLKPSNILFAQDGTVKVGDFGLVTSMGDTSQDGEQPVLMDAHQRHTHRVGTQLYMSPEQVACRPYSYKVDIFSLGVILFELLQPFGTDSERVACLEAVRRGRYPRDFSNNYPKETKVLQMMLSEDPASRPTASGVRACAPLGEPTDERYHFTLPPTITAAA